MALARAADNVPAWKFPLTTTEPRTLRTARPVGRGTVPSFPVRVVFVRVWFSIALVPFGGLWRHRPSRTRVLGLLGHAALLSPSYAPAAGGTNEMAFAT